MTDRYQITGYFYEEQGYKFRLYLDINRKQGRLKSLVGRITAGRNPDLMVVMMNPGSALPLQGGDDGRAEVSVKPDRTQLQIMKLMDAGKFRFARIVNLSDLRTPNSEELLSTLPVLDQLGIHHSIFSPSRENDFRDLYYQSPPVILAWGVDDRLTPLARWALQRINNRVRLGQLKKGSDCMYYHALQRGKPAKIWVDQIVSQL